MKTFLSTLSSLLLLNLLVSCGGSKQSTGPSYWIDSNQDIETESETVENKYENLILSRELFGAKSSERNSFEIEVVESENKSSLFIYGRKFEVTESFSKHLSELRSKKNLELFIYVDQLFVSAPINIQGGSIELSGNEITFSQNAYFNVSGGEGEDGGQIYFDYKKIKEVGVPKVRFILNGGEGVPSTGGMDGVDGQHVPNLRTDVVYYMYENHNCPSDIDNYDVDCRKNYYPEGRKACPTSGTDAIAPTRPGRGGRKGSFVSPSYLSTEVVASIVARDGKNAVPTREYRGGMGGTPTTARFEYRFVQTQGGSTQQDKTHSEYCPTTRDGLTIPVLYADDSFREALPWGVIKVRNGSLGLLKRVEYSLWEQMEGFLALDFEEMSRSIKFTDKSLQKVDSGETSLVLMQNSLIEQFQVHKKLQEIKNQFGVNSHLKLDSLKNEIALFIGLFNPEFDEQDREFYSRYGVDINLNGFEGLSQLSSNLRIMSESAENLFSELLQLDKVNAQQELLVRWKTISISESELSEMLLKVGKGSDDLKLLMALKSVLARNHLYYLMAYGNSKSVQIFKKRILRDHIMFQIQEFAHQQIRAGRSLPPNFVLDFDLALNQYLETSAIDVEQEVIRHQASQLMAPIYRYAQ